MSSPATRGASSLAAGLLLLQHGIDHLHHEALLGLGQAGDAFELLLQLRCRPALAGASCGRHADQVLDGDAERACQQRQQRDRHPALPALVGGDGLLGDAQGLGQLHLGQSLALA